jgi:segregation and condensation protein A
VNDPSPQLSIFPNPENPLEVRLNFFEGPLDLLLHLIRRKKLEIAEVRLADLTASYLEYLEAMQSVNLDLASEFLDIAATLILIKSRALLPRPPSDDDEEPDEDPEELLRQRLLEYQRFKEAAFALGTRDLLGRDVFQRPPAAEELPDAAKQEEEEFEELSVFDLLTTFQQVMARRPRIHEHRVETESYRIEDRMEELLGELLRQKSLAVEQLFPARASRSLLVLTFMALLELIKHRLLRVTQIETFGPIHCLPHPEFEANLMTWRGTANPASE